MTYREQCFGETVLVMNSWVSASSACAAIALYLALELGRISGVVVSRPLATLEGLVSLPAAVASVWHWRLRSVGGRSFLLALHYLWQGEKT